MAESQCLADRLHRAYYGGAWHGPALNEVLEGVTARAASGHPIAGAHSIHEIVEHLRAWMSEANATTRGKRYESLKGDRDWPPVRDTSEDGWRDSCEALRIAQDSLEAAVRELPSEKLGEGDRSFYSLLNGIVQHNVYHAAQIALLKKLLP